LFKITLDSMSDAELAISFAIFAAKQRDATEVDPDHLLLGCLRAISRFGIATLGPWDLDLEYLGIDWSRQADGPRPKVTFSKQVVELLDRATQIARSAGDPVAGVTHILAAFANEEGGLMGQLKRSHGIASASWRAAVAQLGFGPTGFSQINDTKANQVKAEPNRTREYLTPEEAAEELGVHVQTMRAYIRSGRMPAFRLAGERAIRILRADLGKVLEPVVIGTNKEE
jgi:excisionase family DNA binding protein